MIEVYVMIGGIRGCLGDGGSRGENMEEQIGVISSWGGGVVRKSVICVAKVGDPMR